MIIRRVKLARTCNNTANINTRTDTISNNNDKAHNQTGIRRCYTLNSTVPHQHWKKNYNTKIVRETIQSDCTNKSYWSTTTDLYKSHE